MEQTNYDEKEAKLLKRGKRVTYETLAFSLLACLFCLACLLTQYGVLSIGQTERVVLLVCLGAAAVATFLFTLFDSIGYRKQYRAFAEEIRSQE